MTPEDRSFIKTVADTPDKRYGGGVPKADRFVFAARLAYREPEFIEALRAANALGGKRAAKDVMYGALVRAGIFKTGPR